MYTVKITPTEKQIENVRKSQLERKNKWTEAELRSQISGWIDDVPYQQDVVDLLMQFSTILVRNMDCLKDGLLYYEIQGKIPDNIFRTCNYKSPSVVMKYLYKRTQRYMVENNLAEYTDNPIFIHQSFR